MRSGDLKTNLEKLIKYWKCQVIDTAQCSEYQIEVYEKETRIKLPDDFREFYRMANGMSSHFPNWMDEEGFLFYPIEKVESFNKVFKKRWWNKGKKNILVFAEYMNKSWWYGVELSDITNDYEIGIIPDGNSFKPITKSLSDFIQLYLENSPMLYEYE